MPVRIRRGTYRGREGFHITGSGNYPEGAPYWGQPRPAVNIFTETRTSAERIRDKVKAGEGIELDDFKP